MDPCLALILDSFYVEGIMIYLETKFIRIIFAVGMLLLSALKSQAEDISQIETFLNKSGREYIYRPAWSDLLIHTPIQRKIYQSVDYKPIWVNLTHGTPTPMATALRTLLLGSERHGLNPRDYWNQTLENYFQGYQRNPAAGITFEIIATESLLRYAKHLYEGRVDPRSIDDDIKFTGNSFSEAQISIVNNAISGDPTSSR